jgi:single-strand DNA-binding protein
MNKVMLIGNVGTDPEVRYVDQGVAVARFRFATTEKGYTLQNGTQVPDRTDWHNVILWRRLAEIVERYVHKGDKLYIEGRLRYSAYDNRQGQRQYVTEVWADNMEMLSVKPSGQREQVVSANSTSFTDSSTDSHLDSLPF